MIWSKANDAGTEDLTRSSTIHSLNSDKIIPPTPTQPNIFSRTFGSLFNYKSGKTATEPEPLKYDRSHNDIEDDYSVPLNQSMRTFGRHLQSDYLDSPTSLSAASPLPKKRVNWDRFDTNRASSRYDIIQDFYDSDEEINDTLNSIRNLSKNHIPGSYPETFETPYIARNFKIDQNSVDEKEILQKFLSQITETNKFLEELLTVQQHERITKRDQTLQFVTLKKELAAELENSKQVYEGFRRLLLKYRTLKERLKQVEKTSSQADDGKDLSIQLQTTKRLLDSKVDKINELQRDLKRLTDQRDDLKTTILEYKNQNLRLKTTNEYLTTENTKLQQKIERKPSVSKLEQKNEMLELQITQANDLFKRQSNNLKEQIFDLRSTLSKKESQHEYELLVRDKRIEELEKLLSFKSNTSSPVKKQPPQRREQQSAPRRSGLLNRSRPLSYHEPSTRIFSPIRPNFNLLDTNLHVPKYRSQVLNDENSRDYKLTSNTKSQRSAPLYHLSSHKRSSSTAADPSLSDISLILNTSQDLTGFDNDRVSSRLNRTKRKDANDLSAIFSSPRLL